MRQLTLWANTFSDFVLFCTSDKLCRHPWDSSHLYHFASLSSWIFRTKHCRWSQKLGGIRTMNFRTQTSRLSCWGNLIHLLGSTKKVFKPYFKKQQQRKKQQISKTWDPVPCRSWCMTCSGIVCWQMTGVDGRNALTAAAPPVKRWGLQRFFCCPGGRGFKGRNDARPFNCKSPALS